MFCQKCGKENPEDSNFCIKCGATMAKSTGAGVNFGMSGMSASPASSMSFTQSISTCLGKYFDFSGRASLPEYWWFALFSILLSWAAQLVDRSGGTAAVVNLALFCPTIFAATRRLHDTNRSGWWQLIAFTVIGLIPLVIWLASKGDVNENRYGRPV